MGEMFHSREFFPIGRMMGGTKTGPKDHVCVWNANILTRKRGKIWFGDLDITADGKRLKAFAAEVGEPLVILKEMDCRFMTEATPRWDNAVATVTPDEVTIHRPECR